ncbi:hypothetical protein VTN77DRAFT_6479 [Rasamsonia byssochlamydoides]|uniref:uncharacterized protein n=1 Tax=Rasamsonia byssochlamydoides TaxID=89139 RepID=UPI0037447BC9
MTPRFSVDTNITTVATRPIMMAIVDRCASGGPLQVFLHPVGICSMLLCISLTKLLSIVLYWALRRGMFTRRGQAPLVFLVVKVTRRVPFLLAKRDCLEAVGLGMIIQSPPISLGNGGAQEPSTSPLAPVSLSETTEGDASFGNLLESVRSTEQIGICHN